MHLIRLLQTVYQTQAQCYGHLPVTSNKDQNDRRLNKHTISITLYFHVIKFFDYVLLSIYVICPPNQIKQLARTLSVYGESIYTTPFV